MRVSCLQGLHRAGAIAVVLGAVLTLPSCPGQTAIDLKAQSKRVDFSDAASTKPSKIGTSLPASCSVGETIFLSNALPGKNLYGCVATNTWSVLSGAGDNIQGNPVASGAASVSGEYYAWDPQSGQMKLFTPGSLFSITGSTVNVATESVVQYGIGADVPPSCAQYGLVFFKTDSPTNNKLLYCNGLVYEQAGGSVTAMSGPYMPFGGVGTASNFISTLANRIFVYRFILPLPVSFAKFTFNISTLASGGKAAFAIYDANRQKVVEGSAADASTTGAKVTAASSPTTLQPGNYYLAYAVSATAVATTFLSVPPTLVTISNVNGSRIGFCAEAANLTQATGSQFPGTCTITNLASNSTLPFVLMEP